MVSAEPTRRTGRSGGIIVAVAIGGSAVGVIGWYVMTNRTGPSIDASGFDLSAVAQSRRPAPVLSPSSRPAPQASSLEMMKGDAGVRIGDSYPASSGSQGSAAAPAKAVDKKTEAHEGFTEAARKHESDVRRFSQKMSEKYPIIRQYGRDWMKHPDLKKLNDDYMRNHDPVAFIMGLTKAPSLGAMVKQYAGNPAITEYITQGMKEAPADLMSSAMDVLSNDAVAKNLISNVAAGLGLPPSVTAMIGGGGDMSHVDQKKMTSDIMNSQAGQDALKQQGQEAAPVSLSNQR
jgi:hypothetical protein